MFSIRASIDKASFNLLDFGNGKNTLLSKYELFEVDRIEINNEGKSEVEISYYELSEDGEISDLVDYFIAEFTQEKTKVSVKFK